MSKHTFSDAFFDGENDAGAVHSTFDYLIDFSDDIADLAAAQHLLIA